MAKDNITSENYDLSVWQNKDPLTLNEAACLWAGYPPGLRKASQSEPARFAVMQERRRQIIKAAEDGCIEYDRPEVPIKTTTAPDSFSQEYSGRGWGDGSNYQTSRVPVDWENALITRAALKGYANSIGQRPAFLFPEAVEVSAMLCLDESGPHFSGELAAAILAWQYASELAEKSKKKPRQLIVNWLKKNRPQYPETGKAFERISTLANWNKTTGPKPSN